jgi:hypothetical protein
MDCVFKMCVCPQRILFKFDNVIPVPHVFFLEVHLMLPSVEGAATAAGPASPHSLFAVRAAAAAADQATPHLSPVLAATAESLAAETA